MPRPKPPSDSDPEGVSLLIPGEIASGNDGSIVPTSYPSEGRDNWQRYFTGQSSAREESFPLKKTTNVTIFAEVEDRHGDPFSDQWRCDDEPRRDKKRCSCMKKLFSALRLLFCNPTLKVRGQGANNHQLQPRYRWQEISSVQSDRWSRLPEGRSLGAKVMKFSSELPVMSEG